MSRPFIVILRILICGLIIITAKNIIIPAYGYHVDGCFAKLTQCINTVHISEDEKEYLQGNLKILKENYQEENRSMKQNYIIIGAAAAFAVLVLLVPIPRKKNGA